MRFWTSDLHFGHRNVAHYCNRPFINEDKTVNVEKMHEAMIQAWNAQVKPEDTVVCVGDFSLNPKWSREVTPKLNGYKILIPGNHDACFEFAGRAGKAQTMRQRYYSDGWNEIHQTWNAKLSDGTFVLVSHLPYATESGNEYDRRYQEYRPVDKGSVLIHGHLHGKYKKYGRMIDVGIDAHDFKLVPEADLIALIHDERDFIPSSITEFYKARGTEQRTQMQGL